MKEKTLRLVKKIEALAGVEVRVDGNNLSVGGGLDLSGTGITQLPDNLSVGGWLDLRDTGITQLPDNLSVGGWLDLRDTGITQLPDNLSVGGGLSLSGTGITQLPDNLSVGGEFLVDENQIKNNNKFLHSKKIGSRSSRTCFNIDRDTVFCGCFKGSLLEFKERVNEVYPTGIHRIEYMNFIEECENVKSSYANINIKNRG
ncbi:hypothetical protein LJC53_02955 [Bacteroidales bacterium OttesenSCG-928-C03]|nr:hypothetical protein [Bacteroidales bacterium OttesenSCG-928-C03]